MTKIPKEARNKEEDEDGDTFEESVPIDDIDSGDDPDDFGICAADNLSLWDDLDYKRALESDPVALARALVRICRASGERREEFRKTIIAGNTAQSFADARVLAVLELLLDVVTRWSATFLMIDRFLTLNEVIIHSLSSIICSLHQF